jgi:hypothetical protein
VLELARRLAMTPQDAAKRMAELTGACVAIFDDEQHVVSLHGNLSKWHGRKSAYRCSTAIGPILVA